MTTLPRSTATPSNSFDDTIATLQPLAIGTTIMENMSQYALPIIEGQTAPNISSQDRVNTSAGADQPADSARPNLFAVCSMFLQKLKVSFYITFDKTR